MGAFEYLLMFAAVILGLAVSDLAISTHRLLNAGRRVRWDGLPIMAAVLAFERIVTQWWTWYGAKQIAPGLTFGMFAGVLVSAAMLFLMAAAALPDETGEGAVDLAAHYDRVFRRFWLLFAVQWGLMNVVSTWAQLQISGARLDLASPAYLIVPAALVLAFVRNRLVQTAGLVGFLVLYTAFFFGQNLV